MERVEERQGEPRQPEREGRIEVERVQAAEARAQQRQSECR
jgi:hypothetical protein